MYTKNMPKLVKKKSSSGFSLVELLVAVAVVAILSVIGFVVFTDVTKRAKDAKRKADIDAISKAYEIRYNPETAGYLPLVNQFFSSGSLPKDPDSSRGGYFNWLASDYSGFRVCAALENNPSTACNTPSRNCYCRDSTQGKFDSSKTPYALPGDSIYSQESAHTNLSF